MQPEGISSFGFFFGPVGLEDEGAVACDGEVPVIVGIAGIGGISFPVHIVGYDVALSFAEGAEGNGVVFCICLQLPDAVYGGQVVFLQDAAPGGISGDGELPFFYIRNDEFPVCLPFYERVWVFAVVVDPGRQVVGGDLMGGTGVQVAGIQGPFVVPGGGIGEVGSSGAELPVNQDAFFPGDGSGIIMGSCCAVVVCGGCKPVGIEPQALMEQGIHRLFGDEAQGAVEVFFFHLLPGLDGGLRVVLLVQEVTEGLPAEPGLVADGGVPALEVLLPEAFFELVFCVYRPAVGEVANSAFFEPVGYFFIVGFVAFKLVFEVFFELVVPDGTGDGLVELLFQVFVAAGIGDDHAVAGLQEGGERVAFRLVEADIRFVELILRGIDDDVGFFEQGGGHVVLDFFHGEGQLADDIGAGAVVACGEVYVEGFGMEGAPFVFMPLETVVRLFRLGSDGGGMQQAVAQEYEGNVYVRGDAHVWIQNRVLLLKTGAKIAYFIGFFGYHCLYFSVFIVCYPIAFFRVIFYWLFFCFGQVALCVMPRKKGYGTGRVR